MDFFSSLTNEEKEQIMDSGEKAIAIMENVTNLLGERQTGRYVYLQKEKGTIVTNKLAVPKPKKKRTKLFLAK